MITRGELTMNLTKILLVPLLIMFLLSGVIAQNASLADQIRDAINNSGDNSIPTLIIKNLSEKDRDEVKEVIQEKLDDLRKGEISGKNARDEVKEIIIKKATPEVIRKIKDEESVRVWIKYEEGSEKAAKRASEQSERPEIETILEISSEEELIELEEDSDVVEIIEDPILYEELSVALPYIGGTEVQTYTINGNPIDGEGQTVCVVDGGITYTNPSLGGCFGEGCKVVAGYDYANKDDDPKDPRGHGTHVAGIVAADGKIKGVAPKANLIAQRVCNDKGSCYGSSMSSAITWCADNAEKYNIVAITISIGDKGEYTKDTCPTWMDSKMKKAHDKGIIITAASGNQKHKDGISYPACSPYVTAVGASGRNNNNIRSSTNRGYGLDLLAPGTNIRSTCGNSECTKTGTSMATPFVAGSAALIKQYYTDAGYDITGKEIETLLQDTGVSAGGYKRIDLVAAFEATGYYKNVTLPVPETYDISIENVMIANKNSINVEEPVEFYFDFESKENKTEAEYTIFIDETVYETNTINFSSSDTIRHARNIILDEGVHVLKIVVDKENIVNETDETNNEKQITFDVNPVITCYMCNENSWTVETTKTVGNKCDSGWEKVEPVCKAPEYDLEVKSIQIPNMNPPNTGEPVEFYVNFVNHKDRVDMLKYDLIVDGEVIQTRTVPEFSAESETRHTFGLMLDNGRHVFKIVVDSDNQFLETDEGNNQKSVTFDVYGTDVSEWPYVGRN